MTFLRHCSCSRELGKQGTLKKNFENGTNLEIIGIEWFFKEKFISGSVWNNNIHISGQLHTISWDA